jgi:hypothetical protein
MLVVSVATLERVVVMSKRSRISVIHVLGSVVGGQIDDVLTGDGRIHVLLSDVL